LEGGIMSVYQTAIIADQRPLGTDGGAWTAGARITRTINTEVADPHSIVTISSNQFALQAGKYEIEAYTACYGVGQIKTWLHNITDAADHSWNQGKSANENATIVHKALVDIASTKTFEIQQENDFNEGAFGQGVGCDHDTECFVVIVIRKHISGGTMFSEAVISDQKTSGTDGGTFTLGARRTRELNTENYDPDGIVTVSANQFTLQAGTYEILGISPAHQVQRAQSWLYNVTDATDQALGMSHYSVVQGIGYVHALFTIASAKTFEIQHKGAATRLTSGFGVAGSFDTEQYATVRIRKYND
jgi:hypothetical protein